MTPPPLSGAGGAAGLRGGSTPVKDFIQYLSQQQGPGVRDASGEDAATFKRYLPVLLEGRSYPSLVDSGNTYHSCISAKCALQIGFQPHQLRPVHDRVGVAAGEQRLKILGQLPRAIPLQIGGLDTRLNFQPVVVKGLTTDVNISGPFMKRHGMDQLHSEGVIRFQGKRLPLFSSIQLSRHPRQEVAVSNVYVQDTIVVPPLSTRAIPLRVPEVEGKQMREGDGLMEGGTSFMEKTDLHPCLHALVKVDSNGTTFSGVMNTRDHPIRVQKGTLFGTFTKACSPTEHDQHPWHVSVLQEGLPDVFKADSKEEEEPPADAEKGEAESEDEQIAWIKEAYRLHESPLLPTAELQHQAALVLHQYWDVLGRQGGFGKTDLLEHEIHLTPGPPIKCRHRPINPALEPSLKEQLKQWLANDVIEPSKSPWSFALVAAPKKNGKIRWCVDFRRLNERTIADTFPLPQVEDNLSRLANSQVFSTVDGSGAFHVVGMRKRDRSKTAFTTPWGLYHFKRMPFGLCNGPATYCRLVQLVLQGIPTHQAIPYLDDTIVHSPDLPSHFKALARTLTAFQKARLVLQPEKCHLFRDEVEYLGHRVTKQGLKPIDQYVQLVKNWPLPTNKTQARAFLGKVGYYRRFIQGYSGIAAPWTDVTGKNADEDDKAPLKVTAQMKEAFYTLKQKLIEAPILAYPNFNSPEPFIVDTDWSQKNNSMGAVLSQVQDGKERVICYGGKKMSKSQRNYPPTKGELAAVIYFLKHWRYYLQHRPFLLRTDHQPLVHIHNLEPQEAMVHRWLDTLASFDFTVKYRKGASHGNADAMSRAPHLPPCDETKPAPATDEEDLRLNALIPVLRSRWDASQLQHLQQSDEDLALLYKWKKQGLGPQEFNQAAYSADCRLYVDLFHQIVLDDDGLLYYKQKPEAGLPEQLLLVLPSSLIEDIMTAAHRSVGHKGVNVTLAALRKHVFFLHMRRLVTQFIAACPSCQARQGSQPDQRHTYAAPIDGYPFQRLSIDFVGPMRRSKRGNNYILTCRDTFSRWLEAFPINEITTKEVARVLEREIFCRYGLPDRIHSDRGSQFTSQFFHDLGDALNISTTTTPAYNPKSNPVERAHRDIKDILRGLMEQDEHSSWEDFLPQAVFAVNTAVCEVTGLAPYQILFGHDVATPLDHLFEPPPEASQLPSLSRDHHDYIRRLHLRIRQAHAYARKKIGFAVRRQRRRYNKDSSYYQLGARVWLFTPVVKQQQTRKFTHFWTGPWTIAARINPVMVSLMPHHSWKHYDRPVTVSIDRLKPFLSTTEVDPRKYEPTQPDLDFAQADDPFLECFDPAAAPSSSSPRGAAAPPPPDDPDEDDDQPGPGPGPDDQGPGGPPHPLPPPPPSPPQSPPSSPGDYSTAGSSSPASVGPPTPRSGSSTFAFTHKHGPRTAPTFPSPGPSGAGAPSPGGVSSSPSTSSGSTRTTMRTRRTGAREGEHLGGQGREEREEPEEQQQYGPGNQRKSTRKKTTVSRYSPPDWRGRKKK